jgi:hypothetical protein
LKKGIFEILVSWKNQLGTGIVENLGVKDNADNPKQLKHAVRATLGRRK